MYHVWGWRNKQYALTPCHYFVACLSNTFHEFRFVTNFGIRAQNATFNSYTKMDDMHKRRIKTQGYLPVTDYTMV
jgi:hypothetical protein